MARVVLHVGPHKTGTTYLQNLFFENRAKLAKHGMYYPDFGPDKGHHILARPWLQANVAPATQLDARGPDGPWEDLVSNYAHLDGTVFLSSENFSRGRPEAVNMAELAQRLSAFEDVRVIYVMRAQAQIIQSIWLQLAKSGNTNALYPYVRSAIEERRARGIWIDYNAAYDTLLQGFSPEQIQFFDYGQVREAPGGIAQVFLDAMDIDLRAEDLTPLPPSESNISPDPLGFWIASKIVWPDAFDTNLIKAVTQIMRETGRPNTLLARHEYVKIATRYGAANEKLVARLQAVQPGFTFHEVTPPDDLIYREEVPDATWLEIARAARLTKPAKPSGRQLLGRAKAKLKKLKKSGLNRMK